MIKIKILKEFKTPDFGLLKQGSEIEIEDYEGEATSQFWRNRIADAKIDNAIEIIKTKKDK